MYRPDRLPKVLTSDEAQVILAEFNTRYRGPHRHRVMCRVMLEAGLRAGEVVALKRDHVDLGNAKVTVREGKGAKDRVVWINAGLRDEIAEWLERDDLPESEYLFPTRTGRQMDTSTLRRAVKRAAREANVSEAERVSPHTFRHTYATELYRRTGNLRLVQENLGHASIETTELYTHLVDGEREEAGRGFRMVE